MKILLISYLYPPDKGAVSARAETLTKALIRKGHEVKVVRTWSPDLPYKGYLNRCLIYSGFFLSYSFRLLRELPLCDAVIYVSPWSLSPLATPAAIYGKLRRSRVLLDVVDFWPEALSQPRAPFLTGPLTFLSKFQAALADGIICNGKALAETMRRFDPSGKKTTIAFNGVDTDFFKPLSISHEGIIVMYSGTLSPSTDFDTILLAADILKDVPELKFIIRGDGELEEYLRARTNGMQNVVFCPGWITKDAFLRALGEADIFVFAQIDRFDVLPTKAVEQMAMGKPVVGATEGDLKEIMNADKSGLTVPRGDGPALAAAIMDLVRSRPLREEMGKNARESVERRFSLGALGNSLETILR